MNEEIRMYYNKAREMIQNNVNADAIIQILQQLESMVNSVTELELKQEVVTFLQNAQLRYNYKNYIINNNSNNTEQEQNSNMQSVNINGFGNDNNVMLSNNFNANQKSPQSNKKYIVIVVIIIICVVIGAILLSKTMNNNNNNNDNQNIKNNDNNKSQSESTTKIENLVINKDNSASLVFDKMTFNLQESTSAESNSNNLKKNRKWNNKEISSNSYKLQSNKKKDLELEFTINFDYEGKNFNTTIVRSGPYDDDPMIKNTNLYIYNEYKYTTSDGVMKDTSTYGVIENYDKSTTNIETPYFRSRRYYYAFVGAEQVENLTINGERLNTKDCSFLAQINNIYGEPKAVDVDVNVVDEELSYTVSLTWAGLTENNFYRPKLDGICTYNHGNYTTGFRFNPYN